MDDSDVDDFRAHVHAGINDSVSDSESDSDVDDFRARAGSDSDSDDFCDSDCIADDF